MTTLHEMEQTIRSSERTLKNAEESASAMARVLRGRLRKVQPHVLAELKKELSQFNAKTQTWKN